MAVYCMQCGKELPDDANFCLKCGKPVGSTAKSAPQPELKWEYCEIVHDMPKSKRKRGWVTEYFDIQFWAKGIRSTGKFDALPNEEFLGGIVEYSSSGMLPSSDSPFTGEQNRKAVDALLARLIEGGGGL